MDLDLKKEPDLDLLSKNSINKDDLKCAICFWLWIAIHGEQVLCLRIYNNKQYCKSCVRGIISGKSLRQRYENLLVEINN